MTGPGTLQNWGSVSITLHRRLPVRLGHKEQANSS